MSDHGDFTRGYFQGARDTEAARAGANAAFWDRRREQQAAERAEAAKILNSGAAGDGFVTKPVTYGGSYGVSSSAPLTFESAVKGGAVLFVAGFVLFLILAEGTWTSPQALGWGVACALLGAAFGAAFYVALVVLRLALKVAAWVVVVAILLHLLGVVNLFAVARSFL